MGAHQAGVVRQLTCADPFWVALCIGDPFGASGHLYRIQHQLKGLNL
jgi:hypothetical protein